MKKKTALLLALALCLTLTACGEQPAPAVGSEPPAASESAASTPADSAPPAVNAPEEEDIPDSGVRPEMPEEDRLVMVGAYADMLETLLQTNTLPDGRELPGDMGDQCFALQDVDGDGAEELIFSNGNAPYMAAMAAYVYAYDADTETLRLELAGFPAMDFYDNGAVKVEWSHNQGLAGDSLWPYDLLQYDAETDSYRWSAMVDAWDRSLRDTNEQGEPFPTEVDTSGTGVVYFIMTGKEYDTSHPVDVTEYEAWVQEVLGGAQELNVTYREMTEDNIARLRAGELN